MKFILDLLSKLFILGLFAAALVTFGVILAGPFIH